jgi:hypothetical protein
MTIKTRPESIEAFDRVRSDIGRQQAVVYFSLLEQGPLTDDAMMDRGFAGPNAIRARRGELVAIGLVYDTGDRAPTRTGSKATVWAARGREAWNDWKRAKARAEATETQGKLF